MVGSLSMRHAWSIEAVAASSVSPCLRVVILASCAAVPFQELVVVGHRRRYERSTGNSVAMLGVMASAAMRSQVSSSPAQPWQSVVSSSWERRL
ncbi:hypothetical protein ACWEPR_39470 [Streptomyces sp. NPDC004290]